MGLPAVFHHCPGSDAISFQGNNLLALQIDSCNLQESAGYLFIYFILLACHSGRAKLPCQNSRLHYRPILSLFSRYACESDNTGGWWLDAGVKLGIGDRWCSLRPSVRSHCPFHSGRGSHRTPGSIRLLWWLHAWGYSIACWCG